MTTTTILSDNGVSSGSAGIKTTGGNDGTLQLQTTTAGGAATTAVTIDTSQNVGIGITSPNAKLDVLTTASTRLLFTERGTGGNVIDSVNGANSTYSQFLLNGSTLIMATGATERARFNSTGAFVLAGGSTSANGVGITFPTTAISHSSSNANTLDDYEEGTWTPSIGGNATYTVQVGQYTKVGRLVTIVAHLTIGVRGTGSTGQITGVPFANAQTLQPISMAYYAGSTTSYASIYGYLNNSTINVVATAAGGSASATDPANIFQNGTDFYFACTYFAST
jgi:hypothetical protein